VHPGSVRQHRARNHNLAHCSLLEATGCHASSDAACIIMHHHACIMSHARNPRIFACVGCFAILQLEISQYCIDSKPASPTSVLSLLICIKSPHTSRPRGARARAKYIFYRFYTAPCGAPHTTPADLGISIYLFLWPRWAVPMRLHAFTELAKRKGCEICVWYSGQLPGGL
jgi:hypothetical protein